MDNIKITELHNTLLKLLYELRSIKTQQQDIINLLKKNIKEESKGWFW